MPEYDKLVCQMRGQIFQHFKGPIYIVIGLAKNAITGDIDVIYQALYDDNSWYTRPLPIWLDDVSDREDNVTGQLTRLERATLDKDRNVIKER